MIISYVTNIPIDEISGGWSGMSYQIYQGLCKEFNVDFPAPVNPSYNKSDLVRNKVKSILGMKRDFSFFSESRLNRIKSQLKNIVDSDILFFHGITPWIKFHKKTPYYCYTDLVFPTYLSHYFDRNKFSDRDVDRICQQEKQFLIDAQTVFFSSDWALKEAMSFYKLNGKNFMVAGLGSDLIGKPSYKVESGIKLLFISLDFYAKGGERAFNVFKELRKDFPKATLSIVGERPPDKILSNKGVIYHGYFSKSIESERNDMIDLIKQSTCLIHPTEKDATPLVLVESGMLGTPALASNKFGIPEMVIDDQSGYLVNDWNNIDLIKEQINSIIQNENFRKDTSNFYLKHFTWKSATRTICDEINRRS